MILILLCHKDQRVIVFIRIILIYFIDYRIDFVLEHKYSNLHKENG